jgi:hypothetical protein
MKFYLLVSILIERAVGEGQDVRLEGLETLKILSFLLLQLHDQFYLGHYLLSISVFSCGFLLSVMMGSSLAISSTSSSISVLRVGIGTLRKGSAGRLIWSRLRRCCGCIRAKSQGDSIAGETFLVSLQLYSKHNK